MTANVETMTYRFADRADVPWHGLGERVGRNEEVTTYEFQRRAGALWEVVKEPLYIRKTHDNAHYVNEHIKTDAMALIRKDTCAVLNIVTQQYKPIQNSEVFTFFEEYANAGSMQLETAGVLEGGKTVWCLANLGSGFTLRGGDRVQGFLLLANSHAGRAGRAKFTPIRVVCANTLAMAYASSGAEYRISHRSTFNAEQVKHAMGLSTAQMTKFAEQCDFLASRDINSQSFKLFLNSMWPAEQNKDGEVVVPRMVAKVENAYTNEKQNMLPNNWWRAYNAVTYAVDHDESRSDKAKRLNSAWFGNGEKLKVRALQIALEMAK